MALMDFYRRARLAGNNLFRLRYAVVRGSVRRSDPDGTSIVPYFPNFPESSAVLQVSIDGAAPINVSLPSSDMLAVLTALNNAFYPLPHTVPAIASAFDSDGCVSIQTATSGPKGSVSVVGGTAAASLGFSTGLAVATARGGDIAGGPEAHVGNNFDVAFPAKAENLSTQSFVKALGRMAGNTDVLFSELSRIGTRLKMVGTVADTAQTVLTPASAYVPVPANGTVCTGYGLLSAASPPEDLASFFFLTDTVTKGPAVSRVVAVVIGNVAVDPPYADASDLTPTAPGNVLGKSFTRAGPVPIDSIFEGRVLHSVTPAVFGQVQVGDIASIGAADSDINSLPWDHRGLRWVVEAVSADGTECSVRPMSKSELVLYGMGVSDGQPVLELNANLPPGKIYGSVTFFTGSFLSNTRLVISPPMPPGASYEIWAAVPLSFREQSGMEVVAHNAPLYRNLVAKTDPQPNAILTRPTMSNAGGVLTIGQCYARVHGREVSLPGQVLGYSVGSTNWVYWDVVDFHVKVTTNMVTALASGPNQLLAVITTANILQDALRLDAPAVGPLTVGYVGAQFQTLDAAILYGAQYIATNPQLEILVFGNQSCPVGGWQLPTSGFHIRGVGNDVQLLRPGGYTGPLFVGGVFISGTTGLSLSDVQVQDISQIYTGLGDVHLTRVSSQIGDVAISWMRQRGKFAKTGTATFLDSDNGALSLDIGALASEVDVGFLDKLVNLRGGATIMQILSVGNYIQALVAATALKLLGVAGAPQDVFVSPPVAHTGATPILRVSNDPTGATKVLDVTKDGVLVTGSVRTSRSVDTDGSSADPLQLGPYWASKVQIGKGGVGPIDTEVLGSLAITGGLALPGRITTSVTMNSGLTVTAKATSAPTLISDDDITLTTKGYVTAQIAAIPPPPVLPAERALVPFVLNAYWSQTTDAGYTIDRLGVVHLHGFVIGTVGESLSIAILPLEARPALVTLGLYRYYACALAGTGDPAVLKINPATGEMLSGTGTGTLDLDSVSFKPAP